MSIEPTQGGRKAWNVRFERVRFEGNGKQGEGVYGAAVSLNVHDTASHNETCFVHFTSCHFSKNRAALGGAIYVTDAHVYITNSTFDENRADVSGGAVYIQGTREVSLTIDGSSFSNNSAQGKTDQLKAVDGKLPWIKDETSAAIGTGGAVLVNCSTNVSITASVFRNNVGHRGGGGLAVVHMQSQPYDQEQTYTIINRSHFEANYAYCHEEGEVNNTDVQGLSTYFGGAIYYDHSSNHRPGRWEINATEFLRNEAAGGGAICLRSHIRSRSPNMILYYSLFKENFAKYIGGAIFTDSLNINVFSTAFRKNEAQYGGSLFLYQSPATQFCHNTEDPKNVSVIEESVAYYGGGMLVNAHESMSLSSSLTHFSTICCCLQVASASLR